MIQKTLFHPPQLSLDFFRFASEALDAAEPQDDDAQTRVSQPQIISNLNTIIDEIDAAVQEKWDFEDGILWPLDIALHFQALALAARYRLSSHVPDITRSIFLLELLPQVLKPSNQGGLKYAYENMVMTIQSRVHHDGIILNEDLDHVIEAIEALFSLLETGIPNSEKLHFSEILYEHLKLRVDVDQGWSPKDRERILQVGEDMLRLVEEEDPSTRSRIHAEVLVTRSRIGDQIKEWKEALVIFQKVDDPELASTFLLYQFKIAIARGDELLADALEREIYSQTFDPTGVDSYITWLPPMFYGDPDAMVDSSIEVLQRRSSSYSPDTASRIQASVSMLIAALRERFERFGRPRDIQTAVAVRSDYVQWFGPLGRHCIDILLLRSLHEILDDKETDLMLQEAKKIHKPDSDMVFHCMCYTMRVVSDRVQGPPSPQTVLSEDLDPIHRDLYDQAWTLLNRWHERGESHTDFADLEQGVGNLHLCMKFFKENDDAPGAWEARKLWALYFFQLHLRAVHAVPHHGGWPSHRDPQICLALDYLEHVAGDAPNFPLRTRFATVARWFECLLCSEGQRKESIPKMCELALSLCEQFVWETSTGSIRTSLGARNRFFSYRGLLGSIVISCVDRNLESRITYFHHVLKVIGALPSIAWGQLASLRVPLDELSSVNPGLASQFQKLSNALERRLGLSDQAGFNSLGTYNLQIYEDRIRVIQEIRAIPGFHDFLERKSGEDLMAAASEGPVVILATGWETQCIAIIIGPNFKCVVDLPISAAMLKTLHQNLRGETYTRDGDVKSGVEEDEDVRAARKVKGRVIGMNAVLEVLWEKAVKLIVDMIFKAQGQAESLKEGETLESKLIPISEVSVERNTTNIPVC